MTDVDLYQGIYMRPQPAPVVYGHATITVGICTYDGQDVIVLRGTISTDKFEQRMRPDSARKIGNALLELADLLENGATPPSH